MRYIWVFLLALTLTGCSISQRSVKNEIVDAKRELVFPYGTYKHDVHLEFREPPNLASPNEKVFDLKGIVKIDEKDIKVAALSPFGTTVFTILENRITDEVKVEVYVESLKKLEPKLREYYAVVRAMLLAPMPLSRELPSELRAKETLLRFSEYDDNKIPLNVLIEHERFNVNVVVSGYEI